MNLVKVKCSFCKKEFFREKGRFNEAIKFDWKQYCSKECLSKNKSKQQIIICENCGKHFSRTLSDISPHNYCSRSCSAIVNNKKYPRKHLKPKLKTCIKCGKQFKRSTHNIKYCSMKCRREAEQRHTHQQLLEIIKKTARTLKRVPARREIEKISSICRNTFGSWNNAVIAAGLIPNRSHSQRMYKCTKVKSLDGHLCDSISELIIDNWLTKNNISHKKNVPYPETNSKTDWAISIDNQEIFIEYFGLANDSPRYDRAIKKKKELCRKYNLKLIEIYPRDIYSKGRLNIRLKDKFKNLIKI